MLNLKVFFYIHTLLGRHDIRKFSILKATIFYRNKKTRLKRVFLKQSINYFEAITFAAFEQSSLLDLFIMPTRSSERRLA